MVIDRKSKNSKPKSNVKISNKKIVTKAKKNETKVAITKKQIKKKKGFTLVELIAVVGLLAILMTMTALSVSSINKSVKNRQKNTLLNSIQVAAEKYVNDTGIKKVYVDTLIKEGYVSADGDSTPLVIADPTDENQKLNCYLYDFTEAGKGKYVEPSDTSSTECDMKPLSDVMLTIQYKIGAGSFTDYDGSWIKEEDVTLGVRSNNTSVVSDSDISNNSTWTTPLAPDVYHSPSGTYSLVGDIEDGYLNATYQVTVAKDGATYTASKLIKIDSKVPKITNIRLDTPGVWTKEKYIYADFEDTGSGLAEYLISTKSSKSLLNSSDKWSPVSGKFFSLNQQDFAAGRPGNKLAANGTYYVFVKDVAGNIAMSSAFIVDKIDNIAPNCTLNGENTTWTTNNVIITWGCADPTPGSGCDVNHSGGSTTYTTSAKTVTVSSYTIKDNVGNERVCPSKTANVYIDKENPTVSSFTITSSKTQYNSRNVSYSITGSDSYSGIAAYCFSNYNNSAYCTWQTSSTGNHTFDGAEGSGLSYTRYAFVKDNVGNISTSSLSKEYKLYTYCSETNNPSYGSCSKPCNWGTKSRDFYDKYFTGHYCSTDTTNCYEMDCCATGYTKDGGCTSTGSGSCINQTCYVVSKIDNSICSSTSSIICPETPEPEPEMPTPSNIIRECKCMTRKSNGRQKIDFIYDYDPDSDKWKGRDSDYSPDTWNMYDNLSSCDYYKCADKCSEYCDGSPDDGGGGGPATDSCSSVNRKMCVYYKSDQGTPDSGWIEYVSCCTDSYCTIIDSSNNSSFDYQKSIFGFSSTGSTECSSSGGSGGGGSTCTPLDVYQCNSGNEQRKDSCGYWNNTGDSCSNIDGNRCVFYEKYTGQYNVGSIVYLTYCVGSRGSRTCYDYDGNSYAEGTGWNYAFKYDDANECHAEPEPTGGGSTSSCMPLYYSGASQTTYIYTEGYKEGMAAYIYGNECVYLDSYSGYTAKVTFGQDLYNIFRAKERSYTYWPVGQYYGYMYYGCLEYFASGGCKAWGGAAP